MNRTYKGNKLLTDYDLDSPSTIWSTLVGCAEIFMPPIRMKVSEACSKHMMISSGGYSGLWSASMTPYMIEPMDSIISREVSVVAFAGCARSGKTQALLDGMIAYTVACDPSDVLVVHMTDSTARRYSRTRLARMFANSPTLRDKLSPLITDNNILSKFFKNGTMLQIAYPAPSQLAAAEFKYVLLTDTDRYPDDTAGDGSIFEQAKKRTQTFLSAGTTVVESSPSRDFVDNTWTASSEHEAPPVEGILGIYNQGDRRLWCWICPHDECGSEILLRPSTALFCLPTQDVLINEIVQYGEVELAKKYNRVYCPNCGGEISYKQKRELNAKGYWKPEKEQKNKTRSYWLSGVAAVFQTWESLLENYFKALLSYSNTGDEGKLKACLNVDWGMVHIPMSATNIITAEMLEMRSEPAKKHMLPKEVRFIITSIDVQAFKFVVQVQGFGENFESWIIDRYDINVSPRSTEGNHIQLDPSSYTEDWSVLLNVIDAEYHYESGIGSLKSAMTVCDSGGKQGVTENSYRFWKLCRMKGLSGKFNLVKGSSRNRETNAQLVYKSVQDKSSSAARKAKVTGLLPLWIINVNVLKDSVHSNLGREFHGADFVHFPDWLPMSFYKEAVAERRTEKGWEKIKSKANNETFDLLVYAKAAIMIKMSSYWQGTIVWSNPPNWATEAKDNIMFTPSGNIEPSVKPKKIQRTVGRMKR